MLWLIAGLAVFLGIHSLRMLAPGWRDARIQAMGEGPWKGVYSLVSIAGLILLVWGYTQARPEADILFVPPVWTRHLAWLLMALSFVALMVANLRAGRLKPLLKHPMLLAVKLWAFAHLLANGDSASALLFGAFLVWAVINRIAVKRRDTPLPPPGPVVNDIAAVASGLVLWALFIFWAHEWLFGVSPVV
ncbi:NnrU family protein [Salaquimonas pukyongi]|uniref:NnrU family protein n=1 Tax=Salaquimonas pukyongi TaxID=2712698 RepID=UPI00096BA903|nr:NnrU family protein [Salaquimonas pukyongi]